MTGHTRASWEPGALHCRVRDFSRRSRVRHRGEHFPCGLGGLGG
jgi:hypothetical protein